MYIFSQVRTTDRIPLTQKVRGGLLTPARPYLTLLTGYEYAINRRKSVSSAYRGVPRSQWTDNHVKVHGHLRAGVGCKLRNHVLDPSCALTYD